MNTFRPDIQALRGLAVLLVVMYHADIPWFSHGYLGVDVFFVISGYLISRQIIAGIAARKFSFVQFYYRRAMRLLPATYVVVVLCIAVSPFLLLDSELLDFTQQAIGALTFTSNYVLLGQSGYFESAANQKPLLHFWSLSLEEQYYLLIPLALVLFRNWQMLFAVGLTAVSYTCYLWLVQNQPNSAFFLLSTRLWELGIGSILAILVSRNSIVIPQSLKLPLSILSVAGVCLIATLWQLTSLPVHVAMLLICLSTACIIALQQAFLNRGWIVDWLSRIGTISYSVYLVHWPIFAFLHNANNQEGLWWPYRLTAILASIVAGALIYALVEQRFRIRAKQTQFQARKLLVLVFIPLTLIAYLASQNFTLQKSPNINRLAGVIGLSQNCFDVSVVFSSECQSAGSASILIWGDSYAQHLIPGLIDQSNKSSLIQATKSTCAPIAGLTLNSPPRFSLSKARACEKFNRQILTEILKRPEIQTVVLSALWSYLLSDETWKFVDNQAIPAKRSVHEVVNQLQKTVLVLQQAGRKVLLVAPPPSSSFNLGKCALKKHQNIVGFGSHPECSINLNRDTQLNEFLRIVEETNIAPVYRFEPLLCESDRCASQIGEVIIYRDGGHLSYEGSVLLGALDNWPVLFQQLAR